MIWILTLSFFVFSFRSSLVFCITKHTYLSARTRVYSKSDWYLSRGIVPLLLIVVCVQHVLSAINNILESAEVNIQRGKEKTRKKKPWSTFKRKERVWRMAFTFIWTWRAKNLRLIDFCSESSGLSRLAALQGNAPLNILPQILPFWQWCWNNMKGWCIERRAAEGVAIIWRATYPLVQRSQHMDMQTGPWGVQRATLSFEVFLITPKLIDFSSLLRTS